MEDEQTRREQLGELSKDELIDRVIQLEKDHDRLTDVVENLRDKVEQLTRSQHRSAAPHRRSEDERSDEPASPGRSEGHEGNFRAPPGDIDQTIECPLDECPGCGRSIDESDRLEQFIIEVPPVTPTVTRLVTESAQCGGCGQTVRSSHPLQTSTAGGAARTQFGPRAKALAVDLHQHRGLSLNKTAEVLAEMFSLEMQPSTISHFEARAADQMAGDYEDIRDKLRDADAVYADETGWWISWEEGSSWLWSFSSDEASLFRVDANRNRQVVKDVLGEEFAGTLISDCLNIYDGLSCDQQKCYSHHLRALSRRQDESPDSQLIAELKRHLRVAMVVDATWEELDDTHRQEARRNLGATFRALLATQPTDSAEQRAIDRLSKQREHLLTFLGDEAVEATNNRAERELRPAVITRKLSAGNKTKSGARVWQTLASVRQTLKRQDKNFVDYLQDTYRLSARSPPIFD